MNEYETSDLGTASYLLTIGHQLLTLNRVNPRRALFIFERTSDIERTVEDFWNGTARVAPLALLQSQKTLKSRIYASERP